MRAIGLCSSANRERPPGTPVCPIPHPFAKCAKGWATRFQAIRICAATEESRFARFARNGKKEKQVRRPLLTIQ